MNIVRDRQKYIYMVWNLDGVPVLDLLSIFTVSNAVELAEYCTNTTLRRYKPPGQRKHSLIASLLEILIRLLALCDFRLS
jgi:hypothetical protein